MIKEEIKKEIETHLFLIRDAAEKAYELLDKHGETILPFEIWFNLRFECKQVNHKFSKIADTFENTNINIFNLKKDNNDK